MRDYCGKNGCYDLEEGDGDEQEILCVYLNSPVIYEEFDGEFRRVTAENRSDPDAEFIIENVSPNEGGEYIPTSMEVSGLGLNGVNEFVSALLKYDIDDKDKLILAVKKLLDEDNVVWGIIEPDEEE